MRGRYTWSQTLPAAYRRSLVSYWASERADPAPRCEILKRIGAKFYGSLADYNGATFLKSWGEKSEGEIGPLVKYPFNE
jgi:hypothetical protein